MTDKPLVWHYGLMAERWAEFITEAREVPFFMQKIAQYGQPVLDAACGTGRVLLPLRRAGIDIDGNDFSQDMLRYCQNKAAKEGLTLSLFNQSMHVLELPRQYRTIYICDSFGLAGSRANDLETLRRCYALLEDGGILLLNIQAEYTSAEAWNQWLPESRRMMPPPWPEKGNARIAPDGSEHFAQFRLLEINPLEQSYTKQVRLEKWLNGQLAVAEEYTLREEIYFKNELTLMLKVAGFRDIAVYGDYTEEPATASHEELIFTAIR